MDRSALLPAILHAYRLSDATPVLLQDTRNSIYRLDTADRRYVVRICPDHATIHADLEDEVTWLTYVAQRHLVRVPTPVQNQQGAFITSIDAAGNPFLCCVFEWIEGETASRALSEATCYQIGHAIAQLHQLAKEWIFPTKDVRFRSDYCYDSSLIESHRVWIDTHHKTIGAEQTALVHSAVDYVLHGFDRVGETVANFGFIHADLHLGNFLVHNERIAVIDFDQLGRGHYCYDLAVVLVELLRNTAQWSSLWEKITQGYQQIAPLPFDNESELDPYIVAVQLAFLDWIYNTPNPAVRAQQGTLLPQSYALIRAYMR